MSWIVASWSQWKRQYHWWRKLGQLLALWKINLWDSSIKNFIKHLRSCITHDMEWIIGFSYVPCVPSMSVGCPLFPTLPLISVFRDITWDEDEALCLVTQEHVQAEFILFTSCSGQNMTLFTLTWEVHSKGRLVIWVCQLPSRPTPSLWSQSWSCRIRRTSVGQA